MIVRVLDLAFLTRAKIMHSLLNFYMLLFKLINFIHLVSLDCIKLSC